MASAAIAENGTQHAKYKIVNPWHLSKNFRGEQWAGSSATAEIVPIRHPGCTTFNATSPTANYRELTPLPPNKFNYTNKIKTTYQ